MFTLDLFKATCTLQMQLITWLLFQGTGDAVGRVKLVPVSRITGRRE